MHTYNGDRHLAAQRSSGLPVIEYCRKAGISRPTFYYWRKRAMVPVPRRVGVTGMQPTARVAGPAFTEIPLAASCVAAPYCVRLAEGDSVEIARGFDRAEVGALLLVVRACRLQGPGC